MCFTDHALFRSSDIVHDIMFHQPTILCSQKHFHLNTPLITINLFEFFTNILFKIYRYDVSTGLDPVKHKRNMGFFIERSGAKVFIF